jgi:hypothetical protein
MATGVSSSLQPRFHFHRAMAVCRYVAATAMAVKNKTKQKKAAKSGGSVSV